MSEDRSRLRDELGASTSLSVALLTPVFVVLAFAAFQAAMWSHARTEARVMARDTAALVARAGVAPDAAQASARSALEGAASLSAVDVSISTDGGVVTVTITADAPGIIRGTSSRVSVTEAVPVEGVVPR